MVVMRWYAIAGLLAALLLSLGGNALQHERLKRHDADCAAKSAEYEGAIAKAEAVRLQSVRDAERRASEASQEAQDAYQKGLRDAQAAADATTADLRSGTLKLRDEWRGCEARYDGAMSGAAAAAERDHAAEQRRSEGAGDLVRVADECDAQVIALQARVKSDFVLCGGER